MSDTFLNPVTTQTWANGRHIVRCVKVIQETWDVRTFCFMADQPIMFFFKPGQFVTLELEIEGKPVMRSYTISSSPSVPYSFSITVKRVPGGCEMQSISMMSSTGTVRVTSAKHVFDRNPRLSRFA